MATTRKSKITYLSQEARHAHRACFIFVSAAGLRRIARARYLANSWKTLRMKFESEVVSKLVSNSCRGIPSTAPVGMGREQISVPATLREKLAEKVRYRTVFLGGPSTVPLVSERIGLTVTVTLSRAIPTRVPPCSPCAAS